MNTFKDLLEHLGQAPDGQLDKSQALKFEEMASRDTDPKSEEVKQILDDCAYAALASDFAMLAIDSLWRMLKEVEENAK